MTRKTKLGGVIHTYQKYDPAQFPSPTEPPPDLASPALEHLLRFGSRRELTEEELARAIRLSADQIAGLGPSLETIMAILRERKRKILETNEIDTAVAQGTNQFERQARLVQPPSDLREAYRRAVQQQQLREIERLWYRAQGDNSPLARQLMQLMQRLGEKYLLDELQGKYRFTGRHVLTIPEALAAKEELEKIDELLRQLEEAAKTAQIGIVDLDMLAEFTEPADMERFAELQRTVQNMIRELAEQQGLERNGEAYQVTPKTMRIFQGKLLERIFSELQASKTGRHTLPVEGDGAVEMQATRPYEFGDSLSQLDLPQSFVNALLRAGPGLPIRLAQDDLVIHRTRNAPKCVTSVIMDMSGSMRYDGQYMNVKRMALALESLIRREYPGDFLQFIEMFTFARPVKAGEIVELLPKPVTIFDPVVRYRIDMSRADVSEAMLPHHFTNIQHALQTARRFLSAQDTPNRQIFLITDGLPTAHFQDNWLYMLYPADILTEQATMREGQLCAREGITINLFLLPSWSQSEEDIRFSYRMAEATKGRVFFTAGKDLDRFVLWDYVKRRREVIG